MTSNLRAIMALAAAGAVALSTPAQAGTVLVSGERYNLNTINNFYNSYGGHTSSIGAITAANLVGVNLLWAVQPADAYTMDELNAMSGFLANGGRIAFMGEHGQFAPNENQRINAALSSLGSDIQIFFNQVVDGGFRSASQVDGQILPHALTTGVNTYQYAAFAPLSVGGTAEILMRGEDNPSTIMMAYQNIGPGSVFLITDQNVWDNAPSLWGAFDNEVMFDNLVEGETGAPPPPGGVPEPATWLMMLLGFFSIGGLLRSKPKRREKLGFAA